MPAAPAAAFHEENAAFSSSTNYDPPPTPEVSKLLLSALRFLQSAQGGSEKEETK